MTEDNLSKSSSSGSRRKNRPKKNGRNCSSPPQQHTATTSNVAGGLDELANNYYDCSRYKQVDKFVSTTKAVKEHVGRTYKNGGDVRATLDLMSVFTILIPTDPADKFKDVLDRNGDVTFSKCDQVSYMDQEIFRQEINAFVKRKGTLESNFQKLYSLLLGQCTELMKGKLKTSLSWESIWKDQDALALLNEIKTIVFKFKDQKYPILSIHNAKSTFYSFRHLQLSTADYLQKFRNTADIETSLGGNLHDDVISKIVTAKLHLTISDPITLLCQTERRRRYRIRLQSIIWLWHSLHRQIKTFWETPRGARKRLHQGHQ